MTNFLFSFIFLAIYNPKPFLHICALSEKALANKTLAVLHVINYSNCTDSTIFGVRCKFGNIDLIVKLLFNKVSPEVAG